MKDSNSETRGRRSKMVVNTLLVIRLVRSKLRKREDHSSSVPPNDVILHTTAVTGEGQGATGRLAPSGDSNGKIVALNGDTSFCTQVASSAAQSTPAQCDLQNGFPPSQFHGLWQYPPQYSLYTNDKETLVQPMPIMGRPGFARGLKKNLSGRWKRLVKKKPTNEVYTIPPDLRDQLKTIYVY